MEIKKLNEETNFYHNLVQTEILVTVTIADMGLSPEFNGMVVYLENPADPYIAVENHGKYDLKASCDSERYIFRPISSPESGIYQVRAPLPATIIFTVTEDA